MLAPDFIKGEHGGVKDLDISINPVLTVTINKPCLIGYIVEPFPAFPLYEIDYSGM